MKKLFYSALGLSLIGLNFVNAIDVGENKVNPGLVGDPRTADEAGQSIITNAIRFLYLIAVIYALWGGFLMLTAGGKEEQMKKGRTVIIQALIGLVVIWLANSIVGFVVNNLLSGAN